MGIEDKKLSKKLEESSATFDVKWTEIVHQLRILGYDVTKVSTIKTIDNLDTCRLCHVAYLRSQAELLSDECLSLRKTTDVNVLTMGRLISNLKSATSLEGKTKDDENISPLK